MMTTRAFRLISRVLFASALFPFAGASSCDAGDRALGGGCPEGETCDPATEDGLHFQGATFGEGLLDFGEVKPLAIGGRQDVAVFDVDAEGRHVPLTLPFTPIMSGGATIEGTAGNVVTLRGGAEDDGLLRIVSQSSGLLFDRVQVATRALVDIRIEPSFTVSFADPDAGTTNHRYAPGAAGFIRLASAEGGALVDEDTAIAGTGIVQTSWDRFQVGDLAVGPHQLTVTAAGGVQRTLDIDIVQPEEVVVVLGGDEVPRDGQTFVCFGARAGGVPVHAAWRYSVEGGSIARSDFEGCVNVFAGTGDSVTVRARAADKTLVVELPVVAGSQKRRGFERLPFGNTAGERAAR